MKQKHPLRVWAADIVARRRRAQFVVIEPVQPDPKPGLRPLTAAEYSAVDTATVRETRGRRNG